MWRRWTRHSSRQVAAFQRWFKRLSEYQLKRNSFLFRELKHSLTTVRLPEIRHRFLLRHWELESRVCVDLLPSHGGRDVWQGSARQQNKKYTIGQKQCDVVGKYIYRCFWRRRFKINLFFKKKMNSDVVFQPGKYRGKNIKIHLPDITNRKLICFQRPINATNCE